MIRRFGTSKRLLQVRPPAPVPTSAAAEATPKAAQQPRRYGLLFLLAGACLATYMIKPEYKPPIAAFDPVKRKVCILFLYGVPTKAQVEELQRHGFTVANVGATPEETLNSLVKEGKSWLALAGVPPEASQFERQVVQCDLALDFNSGLDLQTFKERVVPVSDDLSQLLVSKNM